MNNRLVNIVNMRLVALFLISFIFGLGGGVLFAEHPTIQPIEYNHLIHTQKSDCVRCHRGVRNRDRAGLPSIKVCAECHATAPGNHPSAADKALWDQVLKDNPKPWQRIYRLPQHTYFSHQRHVTVNEIACEDCHGDMEKRESPPGFVLKKMKMRQCIACHKKEEVTVDCTSCHR